MSSSNDYLGLSNHKLFENVRESLPKDVIKTQNLLAVRDGVLYIWNSQDNCVLTLNVKECRCRQDNSLQHQILLPAAPAHFSVELLRVNTSNTLLAVAGPSGVLVLELPERCPPHGSFANNKEMIYCRSHSLEENIFQCHSSIQVRQVRFHPASHSNAHLVVLTSDNCLRLYNIAETATVVGIYPVGQKPTGVMPGTKSFFLGLLGETAVDFDFGPPELPEEDLLLVGEENPFKKSASQLSGRSQNNKPNSFAVNDLSKPSNSSSIMKKMSSWEDFKWPIYILDGDGFILMIEINIYDKKVPRVKGPLPIWPRYNNKYSNPSCSIMCIPCTPPVLCLATINGTIFHSIVLPIDPNDEKILTLKKPTEYSDPADRAVYVFEGLGLELGLAASEKIPDYTCPVFLHPDESHFGQYFATHEGGVHSITIPAVDMLKRYIKGSDEDDDLLFNVVNQQSSADYLVCTKLASSNEKLNPVIGFGIYYDPTSIITLLSNGQLVTSLVASFAALPYTEDIMPEDIESFNSPLKKMLSEPFDLQIQKILKQASTQPILKISGATERSQQECYELLQRASQVFREEHFKHHERAREEIEKRVKVLQMLKKYQFTELERLNKEKQVLQEKAETLAEKYEDIKDKQEDLKKRCEKLLILVSRKQSEPSEAEKNFVRELESSQKKAKTFELLINSLRSQIKYQEMQMLNWNKDIIKKETGLGSFQSQALKTNLQDMTNKITDMINEVAEYKRQLRINY